MSYVHGHPRLKGAGSPNRKPVNSRIYIVAHMWPLRSVQILVDGVNQHLSYFKKSTHISAIVQHMSVSVVPLRSTRVHLQNKTFILTKAVENHSDIAYQITVKSSLRKKFVYIT